MSDVGFTHVALPVTCLDASIAFYATYAGMSVVHRRSRATRPDREIAWLSDGTRPFVLVLAEIGPVEHPLGPFAHLGVACATKQQVDDLCAAARADGRLRDDPHDTGGPAGYLAMLEDPDGHTLELSYGQDVQGAVERSTPAR